MHAVLSSYEIFPYLILTIDYHVQKTSDHNITFTCLALCAARNTYTTKTLMRPSAIHNPSPN